MGSRWSVDGTRESWEYKIILSARLQSIGLQLEIILSISAWCFIEDQYTQGLMRPVEQIGHNREAPFIISYFIHIILDIIGNNLKESQLWSV